MSHQSWSRNSQNNVATENSANFWKIKSSPYRLNQVHLWLHLRLHLSSRHLLALKLFSIKISPSTRSSLFVQSHHQTDSCSWVLKTTKYELSFLNFYYFHLMSYKVLTYSGCLQVFNRKSFTALSITIYLRFSKGKELCEKYLCKQNENGTFEFWENWKLGRNVQLYGESEKSSMKDSRRLKEGFKSWSQSYLYLEVPKSLSSSSPLWISVLQTCHKLVTWN